MTPFQAKRFIQKQIRRWSYLVTSYGWKFDVNYCANSEDMPAGNGNCYALAVYQHEYLKGDLYFCLTRCSKLSDDALEEIVIHEITHMLLAPMQNSENGENTERVTTMVSRLFKGLRK